MPLLNFQSRFVAPIRAGIKAHTIRATRKIPIKVGDPLYLYCGARHPGAFRILPDPRPCTKIRQIIITEFEGCTVYVDDWSLDLDECERLAVADGFQNFKEMRDFWKGRLPFHGQIIHWQPLESA